FRRQRSGARQPRARRSAAMATILGKYRHDGRRREFLMGMVCTADGSPLDAAHASELVEALLIYGSRYDESFDQSFASMPGDSNRSIQTSIGKMSGPTRQTGNFRASTDSIPKNSMCPLGVNTYAASALSIAEKRATNSPSGARHRIMVPSHEPDA